jgi:tetratricopeptide (TPR) repeat protein
LPGQVILTQELERSLEAAQSAQQRADLHDVAERLRFIYSMDAPTHRAVESLEKYCQSFWDIRSHIFHCPESAVDRDATDSVRAELLDLAVLWTDLQVRTAPKDQVAEKRQQALRILAEAEALLGSNAVIERERRTHALSLDLAHPATSAGPSRPDIPPRTSWEHSMMGQYLLRSGDLERARTEFERAIELEPQAFWPNFYRGICAFRLRRYHEAESAFQICVALAPKCAECYYNRALVRAELHRTEDALRDYDRALQLNPDLAAAKQNREHLLKKAGRRTRG